MLNKVSSLKSDTLYCSRYKSQGLRKNVLCVFFFNSAFFVKSLQIILITLTNKGKAYLLTPFTNEGKYLSTQHQINIVKDIPSGGAN